jgi:hypothetical protein
MTDAEIDALAREILTYTVTEVLDWHPDIPHHVLRLPDGELRPVWATVSYVFEFMSLEMIKAIIVECGNILDEFVLSLEAQKNLGKSNKLALKTTYKKGRARTVKMMAQQATLHMIAFFHNRLADMLDDTIEDGKVIAETYLGVTFAKMLDPYASEPVKLDASKGIKAAGERVAANKEKFLREGIEFCRSSRLRNAVAHHVNQHWPASKHDRTSRQRLKLPIENFVRQPGTNHQKECWLRNSGPEA